MPTRPFNSVALIVATILLVGGCIPIPVPTAPSESRYSAIQVEAVGKECNTRDAVRDRLGRADLARADDSIWIYQWTVEQGMWFAVPVLPLVIGNAAPLSKDTFLLVLEFDSKGVLSTKGFASETKGVAGTRYCTTSGVCLEHPLYIPDPLRPRSGALVETFVNDFSAVTVRGKAREQISPVVARPSECLLTIWADDDWNQTGGGFFDSVAAGGAALKITDVPVWSNWRWLPVGAFTQIAVPGGVHAVEVLVQGASEDLMRSFGTRAPLVQTSIANFNCPAGGAAFLAVGTSTVKGNRFPIVLREMDATAAQTLIAKMAMVLLP